MAFLARSALAAGALALLACDLSDLQDGQRGGGGGGPVGGAGGAPMGGAGGVGGVGGPGGAGGDECPAAGPFAWRRAIGNDLEQVTVQADGSEEDLSTIRVASIPEGGFFVAFTTRGQLLLPELEDAIGDSTTSLFVLRFNDAGELQAARAHTQAEPAAGEPPMLLDDAVVRADGSLVVSGHLGTEPIVLQGMTDEITSVSQLGNLDAFVATFDGSGNATDIIRLESTKPGVNAYALVQALAVFGDAVAIAGSYKEGLALNGAQHATLPETTNEPHAFVMVLDGGDLTLTPARGFRASTGARLAATSLLAAQGGLVMAADFDLRVAGQTLTLSEPTASNWQLVATDDTNYHDESLIIAMDGGLVPQWVSMLESTLANVVENVASLGVDPTTETLWLVGSNNTDNNPDRVVTALRRVFSLDGLSASNGCPTSYANLGVRVLTASLDADGECVSIDTELATSAARASATHGGHIYIGGYARSGSFEDDPLAMYEASSQRENGFLISPTGASGGDASFQGALFGGSGIVRVEDVASVSDGLVVVGSMGGELLDAACGEAEDYDLFVAKLPP